MKWHCAVLGLMIAWGESAHGQAAANAPVNPAVQPTEARIRQMTARMAELDASIEKQVKAITEHLSTIKDSSDSGGRVAQIKRDFMQDLKKSIDVYRQLRARRLDELGRPSILSAEEIEKSTDVLDDKIEARVSQIVEIARSFGESSGVKTYETVYDDNYWRHDTDVRETAASIQKRREASRGGQVEDKVIAGLEASIKARQDAKLSLETRLRWAATPEQRAAIQDELREADAAIARRRQQIADLIKERDSAGKSVNQREAFQLDQRLDGQMLALKQDFRELYALAMQRQVEVQRLRSMQRR